ncbi:MAG TPA: alpha-L-rhamnosidase N-terminal domain-containing protein, partial [Prolixibacteraceae bacterium]|nr:alpha-L-rhamnosidase N-terminal domain-containing protein [Prolixibacteraceae bacterium]
MKKFVVLKFLFLFGLFSSVSGQEPGSKINPGLLTGPWSAKWVAWPYDSGLEYGVYHFRKSIELEVVPDEFILHISADNRYRFFVNGDPVCFGPSRGDLLHWHFESIDIAPFLKSGKNQLAAVVWNFANLKPWAQHTSRTGFILQGNTEDEQLVNTDKSWKVKKNEAYTPAGAGSETTQGKFTVVGPCDEVDASKYPWGWKNLEFDDANWPAAKELGLGKPKEV